MSSYDVSGPMFIRRTLDNLDKQHCHFPVTAIINFGFGIIVMSHEECENKLKKSEVPPLAEFGINPNKITICHDENGNTDKSFNVIIRHLRNSVAHWNFSLSGKPIKEICFEDKFHGQVNFRMSFQYPAFKEFIHKLGEYLLASFDEDDNKKEKYDE